MARFGFAAPRERLSDTKIQSMSAAELKAEAHQRGWPFGDMGARSARVLFWQLQVQYLGPETPPTEEEVMGKQDLTGKEQDALEKMKENEAKHTMPGVQPAPDDRTAEQKAAIDNNLESKRAAGITGEDDKTVNPENHGGSTIESVENPDAAEGEGDENKVPEARRNAAGKDAEQSER